MCVCNQLDKSNMVVSTSAEAGVSAGKRRQGKKRTRLDSPWLKRLMTAPWLRPLEMRRVDVEATREVFIVVECFTYAQFLAWVRGEMQIFVRKNSIISNLQKITTS